MDKGPFSVEWLAQSSRGGDRDLPGECRPCPPGPPEQRPRRFPSLEGSPEGFPLLTPPPVPAESPREREAAERPGLVAGPAGAAPGRVRTKFSAAQLRELERSFCEQRYIGAGEKRRLAAALNLSQSQIKTWFQNRRMKFKRQTQDARIEALFSGLFLPCHCYPDTAASSCPHGVDVNVPATSAASLHPAVPNPALLLPSVPAQSLQPVLPSPALLLPPGPGLSCCSSVLPAMTLNTEHKRLMFQPDLPSC
ncbi:homeobox protein vex1-like isoform X1 [Zonotrichia leucophrys gambelii]|uniref:homeobox protein vex1-like isoform X1 n=1 Tax=Zonotrichia leucophrys gambelii TaxID=257770 RepID=UPI00313FE3DD